GHASATARMPTLIRDVRLKPITTSNAISERTAGLIKDQIAEVPRGGTTSASSAARAEAGPPRMSFRLPSRLPSPFRQQMLLHFAQRRARQRLDSEKRARKLEGRELRGQPRPQRRFIDLSARH